MNDQREQIEANLRLPMSTDLPADRPTHGKKAERLSTRTIVTSKAQLVRQGFSMDR